MNNPDTFQFFATVYFTLFFLYNINTPIGEMTLAQIALKGGIKRAAIAGVVTGVVYMLTALGARLY